MAQLRGTRAGLARKEPANPGEKPLLRRVAESQGWKPVWSVPAAMRAARATVVIPSLFAITDKVVGNPQMALFATFGGFATLVIANFGGRRRDKLAAHAGLAVTGSIALIIGTLVSGTTWLAAVVTVPVAFAIFFGGTGGADRGAVAATARPRQPAASGRRRPGRGTSQPGARGGGRRGNQTRGHES